MWDLLAVGTGGFVGAVARYAMANWAANRYGVAFPYGTFIINLTGNFVLGLFLALAARSVFPDPAYRWLVAVGFCGGYTTFSTYTYETLALLRQKKIRLALLNNLFGSYFLGLLAAFLGQWLGNL